MAQDAVALADDYVARAAAHAGVPPRGLDSLRIGLETFLAEAGRSTTWTAAGRAMTDGLIVEILAARFRIEDWIARHPAVLETPVVRPVFIMGLPRAGTTMMVNLLAKDPQRRFYNTWEQNREVPPAKAGQFESDPRFVQKRQEIEAALVCGALDHRQHVEMWDQPAEEVMLLGQDFKSYVWRVQAQSPGFFDWLLDHADMVAAYRHHKRTLQVMQSQAPGKWTLKLPSHAISVDAILQVYPDARIVVTHRDPATAIASSCDSEKFFSELTNEGLDLHRLGADTIRLMQASFDRIAAARTKYPETPFHDFHFRDFTADPIGEVRRIYDFLGDALTPATERAMRDELEAQARLRHETGKHEYNLETFGLSRAGIHETFADYIARYGVMLEKG